MFELKLNPGAVLLRKAVAPFIEMGINNAEMYITPNSVAFNAAITSSTVLPVSTVFLALRMQPHIFHTFSCNEHLWFIFNLTLVYKNLFHATNNDSFRLSGDGARDHMDLQLLNTRTQHSRDTQYPLVSRYLGQRTLPAFKYEYQLVVGIPSEGFRELIMDLRHFGMTASVHVTDTKVTISVGNAEVFLEKELGQCIIGGAVGEGPVSMVFSLYHTSAILNASLMSKLVWLLGQSKGSSVMLNCPVGSLGNLMFYFG